jgi:hypothetical protein
MAPFHDGWIAKTTEAELTAAERAEYQRCMLTVLIACAWSLAAAAEPFQVVNVYPADGDHDVPVSASINLRFSRPVDPETLLHLTLHLVTGETPAVVPVGRATDLTQASITLAPREFLEPNATYEIRGAASLLSRGGTRLAPFRSRFTTGTERINVTHGLVFEQERFDATRSMTTVLFGPDRRLYAADAFGHLVRFDLDDQGRPRNRTVLLSDPRESRQYIDLEWDPTAAADHLVLWASFAERLAPEGERRFFTGTISRMGLGDAIKERIVVTGLPHGREKQGGFETLPHQPNGLAFKDGKLYQSVGSTSSSGGPANWGIPEQPLSACILEIDVDRIEGTLDVHPGAGYDPAGAEAPLRIYATGVRNALELAAHTNGHLYTAVNINDRRGRADGVPDHPAIPGDQNALVEQTTPDHESLYLLKRGRHYGFPNPSRGQYVLAGGNPTSGPDPFEIIDYPVDVRPDTGFDPSLMFPLWKHGGTSPNGMLEYLPNFPHPLQRALLCCFYSAGEVAVLPLGADGLPTTVAKLRGPQGKLALEGPLDITMDPATGILYVADFGKQATFGADGSLVLLRPISGDSVSGQGNSR